MVEKTHYGVMKFVAKKILKENVWSSVGGFKLKSTLVICWVLISVTKLWHDLERVVFTCASNETRKTGAQFLLSPQ